MSRVKIKFPDNKPLYTCTISIRIGDINYGNHVGNDAILSIIHEARMQLLAAWGYDELNAGGNSLIMADVMIAYKAESFYGDVLTVSLYANEITDIGFDLLYHITTLRNGQQTDIAHAKTGMVCFDYKDRKIVPIQPALRGKLSLPA